LSSHTPHLLRRTSRLSAVAAHAPAVYGLTSLRAGHRRGGRGLGAQCRSTLWSLPARKVTMTRRPVAVEVGCEGVSYERDTDSDPTLGRRRQTSIPSRRAQWPRPIERTDVTLDQVEGGGRSPSAISSRRTSVPPLERPLVETRDRNGLHGCCRGELAYFRVRIGPRAAGDSADCPTEIATECTVIR
jgi:hypothetical protein